jgi:hypothetical protein
MGVGPQQNLCKHGGKAMLVQNLHMYKNENSLAGRTVWLRREGAGGRH